MCPPQMRVARELIAVPDEYAIEAFDLARYPYNLGCMGATKIVTDFLSDSRPVS